MKIKIGKTRIVFLVGNFAVKIAKPRLLRLIFRLLFFPFTSKKSRQNYYETYGANFFSSSGKYLLLGFYANLNEFRYWKKYQDPYVIPVLGKYLLGWFIIQKRGIDVSNKNFVSPLKKFDQNLSPETVGFWQYCYFQGKILLVDYGNISTIKDLIKTRHLRTI
jgi:hypothetical protein